MFDTYRNAKRRNRYSTHVLDRIEKRLKPGKRYKIVEIVALISEDPHPSVSFHKRVERVLREVAKDGDLIRHGGKLGGRDEIEYSIPVPAPKPRLLPAAPAPAPAPAGEPPSPTNAILCEILVELRHARTDALEAEGVQESMSVLLATAVKSLDTLREMCAEAYKTSVISALNAETESN